MSFNTKDEAMERAKYVRSQLSKPRVWWILALHSLGFIR